MMLPVPQLVLSAGIGFAAIHLPLTWALRSLQIGVAASRSFGSKWKACGSLLSSSTTGGAACAMAGAKAAATDKASARGFRWFRLTSGSRPRGADRSRENCRE